MAGIIDPISAITEATGLSSPEGVRNAGPSSAAHADFSSVLGSFMKDAATSLRQGEAASLAGIQGRVKLQDVVESVMAAERSFQTALAVRDAAVKAYLEVSQMPI